MNVAKLLPAFVFIGSLFAGSSVFAQNQSEAGQIAAIREILTLTQPNMQLGEIKPSPISGLYEVNIQNGQVIYASSDARYFIPGDLYEVAPEGLVNLGDEKRNAARAAKIAAVDENDMVIFDAKGERKAVLTVFTDVDCPYCRKLHAEVPQLNDMGIAVRYLAYPRTGLDTETYVKMVSTWCADDRRSVFTSAQRGGKIASAQCDNPVASQYRLGREVGVTGTPALVLEDGTILPGYIPAETLAGYMLGAH
ncbi:MAG: thioredoxin fold domain-containing protein [Pseudomonadales bacterium]|nr:thioredoxin fold domain-containing protein [Pseudomonadales bacterium]